MYTQGNRTKWHATGKGRLKSDHAKPSRKEAEESILAYKESDSIATPRSLPLSVAENTAKEKGFPLANPQTEISKKQSTREVPTRGFRGHYSNPLEMSPFERFVSKQISKVLSDDRPRTEGFSVASLVLGIVGWFIPYFGLLCCLLAVIFGIIGIVKISKNPEKFKGMGMAIAGLILGVLGIGVVLLLIVLLF